MKSLQTYRWAIEGNVKKLASFLKSG